MQQVNAPPPQDAPQINFAAIGSLPYGSIVTNGDGTLPYYTARRSHSI